ncbi:SLAC1 family transporter [Streptomyces sp. NPDC005046]
MAKQITCRRINEQTPSEDAETAEGGEDAEGGERVLVDRAWPEGVRRRRPPLDEWLPEVAPSAELQRWYGHNPQRFGEFRRRYLTELDDQGHRQAADRLRDLAGHGSLTLLTATQDMDHSHAALLAEWLTDPGRHDACHPDADPPGPEHAGPGPRPPGYRTAVSAAVADLNPGALAFVMGTAIVSTALYVNGAGTASAVLLWVALAGFAVLVPAYGWRLLRRRGRFVADFLGPRAFAFLTLAISSNVLAARFVPDGHTTVAAAFLAFGALGWLLLDYGIPLALITTVKRGPSIDQVNGTWFLWAVGSESVAVAAASLARVSPGQVLPALAVVCWAVGLMQYLLVAALVLARLLARPVRPEGLMTSVWIFMGAAAITVLAGVRLIALPPGSTMLSRPVIIGSSVVLWSFSSWLIPLLLALGVWRHALRRIPLRYELGWWNIVFPIGMYAVTTHELGRATGTSWMTSMGRWEVWVAAAVWAVVFAAMVAAKLRPRPMTAQGSATATGQAARPESTAPPPTRTLP